MLGSASRETKTILGTHKGDTPRHISAILVHSHKTTLIFGPRTIHVVSHISCFHGDGYHGVSGILIHFVAAFKTVSCFLGTGRTLVLGGSFGSRV